MRVHTKKSKDTKVFNCHLCPKYFNRKETLHSTLRIDEENHGFKIVRKLGSPAHLKRALSSHVSHNSLRAGFSPARELCLRTPSPHHSNSSPNIVE